MINPMNIYIRQLAEEARRACEDDGIIQPQTFKLSQNDLDKIVRYFNGVLQSKPVIDGGGSSIDPYCLTLPDESDEASGGQKVEKANMVQEVYPSNSIMKKTSETEFLIEYSEFSAIDILHELGHVFLEFDEMKVGDIRGCNDIRSGLSELEASKFARAFIMPSSLFEQAIVANSTDGKCDIKAVAQKFDIDYLQVVSYGREAYYWE